MDYMYKFYLRILKTSRMLIDGVNFVWCLVLYYLLGGVLDFV